jgi:glycosyltransferase involved in cell wall biosynthesis
MKTRIIQYQLADPPPIIWGLEGYQRVLALVRRGVTPVALTTIALRPGQTTLTRAEIARAVAPGLNRAGAPKAVETNVEMPRAPISVIVCTRDRPLALARCLAALRTQEYPVYEVVVVDNASRGDATAKVVAATPFRYVREERPGLDWARNRGIDEARYDIIAYVDDDAQADPHWLTGLASAFADPRVATVTGLVLPAELETRAQHLFEQYGGMSKGIFPRVFARETMREYELIAAHTVGVGANMVFRKTVFDRVGLFDTALDVGTPAGGGGDLDMFHRVLTAGLTLRYEPAAIVWHQHRRDWASLRRQVYNNGRAFGVYLLKILRTGQINRVSLVMFAARWFIGWVLARVFHSLIGWLRFPPDLAFAELWGALRAPWAYYETYKRVRGTR